MKKEDVLWKIAVGVAALLFGIGLTGYMLAGATARYMKDDYCYSSTLDRRTFLDGQSYSYLHAVDFSGNRFSLTLGIGLSELAGRWSVSALPAMMIVLWVLGLYLLARQLNFFQGRAFSRLTAFLAAGAIALFTLTQAPNWIQVIYWRPGMFPYFAPIVLGNWLALFILKFKPGKWAILYLAGVFLLALLVGGFSEVANAVEVTALALAVGLGIFSSERQPWLAVNFAALGGALAALALLAFSPVTALRLGNLYGTHASLTTALLDSSRNVIAFYVGIAYRSTLLYASALVFFCMLSMIEQMPGQPGAISLKSVLVQITVWLAVVFVLTWAAMLPSFYAESGAPGERVLVIPTFISVVLAAALGTLAGKLALSRLAQSRGKWWGVAALLFFTVLISGLWLGALQKHFGIPDYPDLRAFVRSNWLYAIGVLVLGLFAAIAITWRFGSRVAIFTMLVFYLCQPALISAHIYAQLPALQKRAALWDQRDAQIRAFRAQGATDITVSALDSLAGIAELSAKPGNWVNVCAAKYYKIKSIKAVEPVLNPREP